MFLFSEQVLIKTHKMDALVTAFYVCYLGVFDAENRADIMEKWLACLAKLKEKSNRQSSIKFDANSNEALGSNSEFGLNIVSSISKYSLRSNFNIKDIIINSYEYKDLIIQLNKIGLKDDHFLTNALILREHCSLPSSIAWPLVYDPENVTLKVLTLLQESIDALKNNLNIEFISASPTNSGAPIKMNNPSIFASVGYNDGSSDHTSVRQTANDSTIAEHALSTNLADLFGMSEDSNLNKTSKSKPNQNTSSQFLKKENADPLSKK